MTYATIRSQSRDALHRAVLDVAIRLLAVEGPTALTMRRVAARVGCSTTVLYTLFGGKQGLVEALWREGFDRLWHAETDAPAATDPLARLAALGQAYRAHALANPDYYRLMFGGAIPGFRPSAGTLAHGRRTFQVLVDATRACVESGLFRREDPELVASVLWATAHGVVSLQLAGNLPEPVAGPVFEHALRAVAAGFRSGPTAASPTGSVGQGP